MKHGFIRAKALERRGCTYKFIDLFEYSDEEQQARRYSRKARCNATLPKVKHLNDKRSRDNFEWRLVNNFTDRDYSAVLTFENDVTEDEARRILENFYKRLRRFYKSRGVDLKRMTVQEYGEIGGRLHYHLIVNSGGKILRTDIIDLWGKIGNCYIKNLDFKNDDIFALCHYLEKQQKQCPKNKCSWSCSKNLMRPEITTDDNAVSRKTMRRLQDAARNDELVKCIEQIYRGWCVVGDPVVDTNAVTGRLFASFKLKRKTSSSSRTSRSMMCSSVCGAVSSAASRLQKSVPKLERPAARIARISRCAPS